MADGDEETVDRDVAAAAVLHRLHAHAGDAAVVAQHLVDGVVPHGFDLAGLHFREQLVLHDLFGAQGVAAVDQIDLAGDVRQIQRFFDRGVAAADHRHVLILVEEAVAGGAGGHAAALEFLFRGDAQVFRGGAGGDDERVAGVLAAVALQPERSLRQVGGVDVVENHFGLEPLSVRLHPVHQVRSHQAVGVARPVVHLGGGHQLATHLQPGDDHRLEVGARRIDGCGPAGGAGAEDDQLGVLGSAHEASGSKEGRRSDRRETT